MKITVTDEDIRDGIPGDPWNCPVALAVKRATGEDKVSVARYSIFIWGPHPVLSYDRELKKCFEPSASLQKFIRNVDMRRAVKPASFIIREAQ
jgi:hypothetical protein